MAYTTVDAQHGDMLTIGDTNPSDDGTRLRIEAIDPGGAAVVYLTLGQAREVRDALTAAINELTAVPTDRKPV